MIRKIVFVLITVLLLAANPFPGSGALSVDVQDPLDKYVSGMSLEEKVGQLFMINVGGTELYPSNAGLMKRIHPGGMVLYRYNLESADQAVRFTDSLQKAAGEIPLLIAADQEGGRVARLFFGTDMPGNMALGAARSPEYAGEAGYLAGKELKALGINVDLAPVLDVQQNSHDSVIGIRSFGSDPRLVADLGLEYIKGLREAGVIATVKHFPGHGDTELDSHTGSPEIQYGLDRLRSVELKPFQQAFDGGVGMVMTAHVAYPAVDDTRIYSKKQNRYLYVPATLSYKVLTGLARNEMGFRGVILTDAMHMEGVKDYSGSQEEGVIMAIKAGADMVMVHTNLERTYNRLLNAVKKGEISSSRIDQSVKRILELKLSREIIRWSGAVLVPGSDFNTGLEEKISRARTVVGSQENKMTALKVAERSVTLLKNDRVLPFKPTVNSNIVLFAPSDESLASMKSALDSALKAMRLSNCRVRGFVYRDLGALTPEQKSAVDRADFVIHASCSYNESERNPLMSRSASFSADLTGYVNATSKPLAVMALGSPYDISALPGVKAYLALYGTSSGPGVAAGIETIFGLNNPTGRLPVAIPAPDGNGYLFSEGYGLIYHL